jgi:4-hydroxyphenylpyruvate dioxygenase-like putative hemolysin
MRLDHIAFRVAQGKRDEAAKFFKDAFGYTLQAEFEIYFNEEKTDKALCLALEPPEKLTNKMPWTTAVPIALGDYADYHLAPEIFISEGTEGSIVGNWVKSRAGVGGIHHLAYMVDDVEAKMKEWTEKGWGDFTSAKPMTCPGLTQVFSKQNMTGVIFEFIKRDGAGFCKDNVRDLMRSTLGD